MSGIRRWLPEPDLDLGRFSFHPRPTPDPLAEFTDEELRARAEHLALRLLDAWRDGYDSPRARDLLARVAPETGVVDLLTGQERRDLGLPV